ncbi:hypothetical protein EDB84DRAFT_1480280 [Lactarius hengduanensis]|nr:hypothetical protein EDB84DRAFT_1480280 [Lactarius hengduanensis]
MVRGLSTVQSELLKSGVLIAFILARVQLHSQVSRATKLYTNTGLAVARPTFAAPLPAESQLSAQPSLALGSRGRSSIHNYRFILFGG